MKIKLYFGFENAIKKSGIGRALIHQKHALSLNGVEYCVNEGEDYDILHINTIYPDSLRILLSAKLNHKKIIYHAHTTEEDFRNSFRFSNTISGLYKKWIVYLYSFSDCIITPTPYSKKLIESYGISCPIYAISNGVDIEKYQVTQRHIDLFKSKFPGNNKKLVISVGWLFERKGFDTFIEAARFFPDVTFMWFGDIVLSHPTSKIKHLLENLPENVVLPGYVDSDVLIGAYCCADVFFFPSREETEGIVILEALSCKCQVLVRDIPAYDPWLIHGENCYKGKNLEEMISYLDKLLKQSIPLTVERGYDVASDRNLMSIGQRLKEVYEEAYYE